MIILKLLKIILVLFVIPELVGLLITRFIPKDKNNIIFAFVIGYIIEFAIAQLLSVPMIFAETTFIFFLQVYVLILLFLAILSIFVNVRRVKEIFKQTIQTIKNTPKLLSALVIILICVQIYGFVIYTHLDDDDSFYVGTAVTTIETNSLFKYSGMTGSEDGEQLALRYRLGPFPVYTAIIAKLIDIHPTIVAHTILPIVFLLVVYMLYLLIANELFKNDNKSSLLFLLIMNVIFIWGGYSGRNNFMFFFFRIWQGKSILANIIIPAVWLIIMKAEENEFKFIDFLLLIIVDLAGTFTTTMGIALVPVSIMVLWFSYEISKIMSKEFKITKSLKSMFMCLGSCIPSIVCGIIYFLPYVLTEGSYLFNLLYKG